MAITTVDEIREYLILRNIHAVHIEKVTGGTGNFIWRIEIPEGQRNIIKHAAPFIATYQEVLFDVERMGFEVRALQILPSILPKDSLIKIPRLLFYDEQVNVLGLEDVGDKTLEDLYEDPRLDAARVGRRLGTWLARLHTATSNGTVKHGFHNQTSKKMSAQSWLYEQLPGTLKRRGFDPALGERIHEQYGTDNLNDEISLCHGDLNPSNLVFNEREMEAGNLAVIDWEMARIGNGVTDLGQFAAEAYFLDHFRGGRGLLQAFLGAYVGERPLSRTDIVRFVVHFGTHVAFWSTMHVSFYFEAVCTEALLMRDCGCRGGFIELTRDGVRSVSLMGTRLWRKSKRKIGHGLLIT
jgi:tRNA A-37 threonylcarbamoyl transferase component Bud32